MNTTFDSVLVALEHCRDAYIDRLKEISKAEKETLMAEVRRLRTENEMLISGQHNTLLPTNEPPGSGFNSRESQLEAEIKRLKEENKELKRQIEDNQNEKNVEETAWHDKVRLELLLRLLENDGTDMSQKTVQKVRVAEVMRTVTGLPISTCKNYCTNRDLNTKVHEEEVLKLNSKLQAIGTKTRL